LAVAPALVNAGPLDEPCRPTAVCTISVEDLPAVVLSSGDYSLTTTDGNCTTLPTTGTAKLAISGRTTVQLHGPAYEGSVELSPADCSDEAEHVLRAKPRPAKIAFRAGVPLSELVVSCVEGCPYEAQLAERFPELPFSREQTERIISLEFKARGYRTGQQVIKLSPGMNLVRVNLEKID
jgi:hypothetical protein